MDVTMIGLQNAGKTSLLRVLAVSLRLRYRFRSCFELIVLYRAANLRSSMCDQDAGSGQDPKQEPCEDPSLTTRVAPFPQSAST
jgi:hypothetical protein